MSSSLSGYLLMTSLLLAPLPALAYTNGASSTSAASIASGVASGGGPHGGVAPGHESTSEAPDPLLHRHPAEHYASPYDRGPRPSGTHYGATRKMLDEIVPR